MRVALVSRDLSASSLDYPSGKSQQPLDVLPRVNGVPCHAGARRRTRTFSLQFRKLTLYPIELCRQYGSGTWI